MNITSISDLPKEVPLVVDLDGTLTPTDTLIESMAKLVKQSPLSILFLPFWLFLGRAGFKSRIAQRVTISAERLPYNENLLAYLRTEKATGRPIVLATAAHQSIADGVASHLHMFDMVLATTPDRNLKASAKAELIRERLGDAYIYAGDSRADLPVWQTSKAAVLVGASDDVERKVKKDIPVIREFPRERADIVVWLRALRVHQWLKNLLLFVPLLTAFSFTDLNKLGSMVWAFLAFSMAASATYLVNDLWDLENDRVHPRKRHRPFASGRLSIVNGLMAAVMLLLSAFVLAIKVSSGFLVMLLVYLMLTSAYSWVLKQYVLVDVLMLSLLYTLRIFAGSVAIDVVMSPWLLAFSVFIFLSLALVKRCAELVSLGHLGVAATTGRDYRVSDLVVLWPLGIGAALSAVVVFGLFINTAETQARYASPLLLWAVAVGLIYWVARLWIKTARGEMHDDPVVYAIRDRGSRLVVFCMLAMVLVAHFVKLEWMA